MVKGVKKFKEFFAGHEDKYIIIGGTACDIQIEDAGLIPRATQDIDLILIVEALDKAFVEQFWEFVKAGNYEKNEKEEAERKYYRFVKPENNEFPLQLELFARTPDILDIKEGVELTPIPMDDDLSSLSAILMDENYYTFTVANSIQQDNISIANTAALIVLKARAFIDWTKKKTDGVQGATKHIRKHKNDIFRLIPLLAPGLKIETPESIHKDLKELSKIIGDEIPGNEIFNHMGLKIEPTEVWTQFKNNFSLD